MSEDVYTDEQRLMMALYDMTDVVVRIAKAMERQADAAERLATLQEQAINAHNQSLRGDEVKVQEHKA